MGFRPLHDLRQCSVTFQGVSGDGGPIFSSSGSEFKEFEVDVLRQVGLRRFTILIGSMVRAISRLPHPRRREPPWGRRTWRVRALACLCRHERPCCACLIWPDGGTFATPVSFRSVFSNASVRGEMNGRLFLLIILFCFAACGLRHLRCGARCSPSPPLAKSLAGRSLSMPISRRGVKNRFLGEDCQHRRE